MFFFFSNQNFSLLHNGLCVYTHDICLYVLPFFLLSFLPDRLKQITFLPTPHVFLLKNFSFFFFFEGKTSEKFFFSPKKKHVFFWCLVTCVFEREKVKYDTLVVRFISNKNWKRRCFLYCTWSKLVSHLYYVTSGSK